MEGLQGGPDGFFDDDEDDPQVFYNKEFVNQCM